MHRFKEECECGKRPVTEEKRKGKSECEWSRSLWSVSRLEGNDVWRPA